MQQSTANCWVNAGKETMWKSELFRFKAPMPSRFRMRHKPHFEFQTLFTQRRSERPVEMKPVRRRYVGHTYKIRVSAFLLHVTTFESAKWLEQNYATLVLLQASNLALDEANLVLAGLELSKLPLPRNF